MSSPLYHQHSNITTTENATDVWQDCYHEQLSCYLIKIQVISNHVCTIHWIILKRLHCVTDYFFKTSLHFFFFFFFFCVPQLYLWGSPLWVRFLRMWPFFNPTIKVVTFRLRGWCVLGVFFVAGIHPSRTWTSGSFESVRWNACLHRLDLGLYSHPKEFWGMEFEPMLTPREKSPLPKMSPEEDRTRDAVDSEPKHYQLSYSGPRTSLHDKWINWMFFCFFLLHYVTRYLTKD